MDISYTGHDARNSQMLREKVNQTYISFLFAVHAVHFFYITPSLF